MKIKAETPTSAQHNGTGIDSIVFPAFAGPMETGALSAAGSGAVMSGCVLDILVVCGLVSGMIEMRAVSFPRPGDGITGGNPGGATATDAAFCATDSGAAGTSGGSTVASAIEGV